MPAYTLKQIESFKKDFEIEVVEYNDYGHYEVQRKKIKKLVRVHTLHNNKKLLIDIIHHFKPDIVHFQEIPETFIPDNILNTIFRAGREYNIIITTHSSLTDPKKCRFIPDKFVLVNKWSENKFKEAGFETDIWEYPIERRQAQFSKEMAKQMLPFKDKDISRKGIHILNVGLFTPGKNQGELFEIARQNPQNTYHFVGNQAENFKDYWQPLMENKPDNCVIWGERDDVDLFYQAANEMYFCSKFELNPLCIKEALSYDLPIKMYKLHTYLNEYDNNPLITYIN